MNDKPIDRNGLTVFHISHFCCEAQWRERKTHNLVTEYVEVRVCFKDSEVSLMVKYFPVDMLVGKIKCHIASFIFQEIEEMKNAVQLYCYKLLNQEKR